jgi:Fe2+ transport system protein FeoA
MIQHAVLPAPPVAPTPADQPAVPLSSCQAGTVVRFHGARLDRDACDLLRALGVTRQCQLTLCKIGEPCIVQVRSTRIGLSRDVANGILVIPETTGA